MLSPINQMIALSVMGKVESETTIHRSLLKEDEGFMKLFTDLINGDYELNDMSKKLVNYVNNHY